MSQAPTLSPRKPLENTRQLSFWTIALFMTILPGILFIGAAFCIQESYSASREEKNQNLNEWQPLFDGRSLAGWEGKKDVFRVEENAIVAGNLKEKIPNNEFLCAEKSYRNFELRLKAKLIGEGQNAGIQFRSVRIPNHHEMNGYQCDMGQMGDRSIWGALYDESRRRKFLAQGDKTRTGAATKKDDWNDLIIRCEEKRIQIWLNGYRTVDFMETDDDIRETGLIGLQIHGGKPAEAWYKDIKIKPLPDHS